MPPSIALPQAGFGNPAPNPTRTASDITSRMDRLQATMHLWMSVLLITLGGFVEVYDLIQ